ARRLCIDRVVAQEPPWRQQGIIFAGERIMTTSSLQGKSVIVTGASKGIGKGIARVFAQAGGAKVLVVSRNLKEAEAAAKEFGNGASGFAADVTKPAEM